MRLAALAAAVACLSVLFAARSQSASSAVRPRPASAATPRARIDAVIRDAIAHHGIRAVIVQATVDGRPVITKAYGMSMTGVPATTKMHFRNGAVAISYMSTLLLRLVDEGKVRLTDKVSRWLPNVPDAHRVTLAMLARMTAGYHDYEIDPRLTRMLNRNPFGTVTTRDQLRLAFDERHQFSPGTNFSYSHSDYVILGLILQKATKLPLNVALSRMILRPLGLRNTVASQTAAIPPPVMHSFSPERKKFLGIPRRTPFDEESTFWNPAWTLARGAVETTDIADLTRTAIGIGSGRLLTKRSYRLQIDPHIGFGHPQHGCERCMKFTRAYGFGFGVVRNGSWILQNPLFAGHAAIESYLPSKRISIALAVTFKASSYDYQGNVSSYWTNALYAKIGKILAPSDPPVA
ncbi:MAG: beta-lactamase family protein [Solirubrobacterales bacterium]|nr:beta-lactamase family protein [Solirubrobacterales bacterium]